MLDFGWTEGLLVLILVILITGPGDIPKVMYMIGKAVRRLQYLRYALSHQFEDFMQQTELQQEAKQQTDEPDVDEPV